MTSMELTPDYAKVIETLTNAQNEALAGMNADRSIFHGLGISPVEVGQKLEFMIKEEIPPVNVVIFVPASGPGDAGFPVVLYYHGGGYMRGKPGEDAIETCICNRLNCVVVCVDYRLSPEARCPAALLDACRAAKWVLSQRAGADIGIRLDAYRVAVCGLSAGGGLSIAVALRLDGLRAQIHIAPFADLSIEARERWSLNEDAPIFTIDKAEAYVKAYLEYNEQGNTLDATYSFVNRLVFEKHAVAPALIISPEVDILHHDAERMQTYLEENGVEAQLICIKGAPHFFMSVGGAVKGPAEGALDKIEEFLRAKFQYSRYHFGKSDIEV